MQGIIQWSDGLALGIPEIDDQHHELVNIINELWEAIVVRRDQGGVVPILEELEHYTVAHFTAEEVLMRVEHYPHLEAHKVEHQAFVARLVSTRTQAAAGTPIALDLLHFLTEWLVQHIEHSDGDYAQFFLEKQRPKSIFGRLFGAFAPVMAKRGHRASTAAS